MKSAFWQKLKHTKQKSFSWLLLWPAIHPRGSILELAGYVTTFHAALLSPEKRSTKSDSSRHDQDLQTKMVVHSIVPHVADGACSIVEEEWVEGQRFWLGWQRIEELLCFLLHLLLLDGACRVVIFYYFSGIGFWMFGSNQSAEFSN
ncbi:hypothetical protein RIF29_24626 [Crotalaria pallida]|uniref:Uncharacterized protein n=1 Tax=Crotalaria pallida TaxID=3830 RepID=A0AAN9EKQ1_CROPI